MIYAARWKQYIKVGYAEDTVSRILHLTAGLPEGGMETILSMEGSRQLEHEAHIRLRFYRTKGEWYRDCVEVRAVINQLASGVITEPVF